MSCFLVLPCLIDLLSTLTGSNIILGEVNAGFNTSISHLFVIYFKCMIFLNSFQGQHISLVIL